MNTASKRSEFLHGQLFSVQAVIEQFALHPGPHTLAAGVVVASAAGTIHALADVVLGDGLAVGGAGILAASVGMDDGTFQTRISGYGVFQRPDAQLRAYSSP